MTSVASLTVLDICAVFLSITAVLAYINHRFIGLPTTIGVMVISMLVSIAAIFLGFLGSDKLIDYEVSLLNQLAQSRAAGVGFDVIFQGLTIGVISD